MRRAEKIIWLILVLAVFASPIASALGRLEGRVLPVMGPLDMISSVPAPPPDYRHRWNAEATKLRNCQWIETIWYLGPRNGSKVRVSVSYTDPPEVRTVGRLYWTGLVVNLDPAELMGNSHSDVVHQCPWRPWRTVTPWFDGTGE